MGCQTSIIAVDTFDGSYYKEDSLTHIDCEFSDSETLFPEKISCRRTSVPSPVLPTCGPHCRPCDMGSSGLCCVHMDAWVAQTQDKVGGLRIRFCASCTEREGRLQQQQQAGEAELLCIPCDITTITTALPTITASPTEHPSQETKAESRPQTGPQRPRGKPSLIKRETCTAKSSMRRPLIAKRATSTATSANRKYPVATWDPASRTYAAFAA